MLHSVFPTRRSGCARTSRWRRAFAAQLGCTPLESRVNPATMVGISGNNLLFFDSATPDTITRSTTLSGLAVGESILDLDVQPSNGQLIALGSTSRLYSINTTTAVATAIGSAGAFTLVGNKFGIDFNPVNGGLRVVSDADVNLRLNAANGTLLSTDTPLAFAAGDSNFGVNPNVVAVAYDNNFQGATSTTLYGIDTKLNSLVIQNPPNGGLLTTVGGLGFDVTDVAAFDIAPGSSTGTAVLSTDGVKSGLYSINLTTGLATALGAFDGALNLINGLAFAPAEFGATISGSDVVFTGSSGNDQIVFGAAGSLLSHNLFTLGVPGFNSNIDFDSTAVGDQTVALNAGGTITVDAAGGDDIVTIGTLTEVAATLGTKFVVAGGAGNDSVTVESGTDTDGRVMTVTDTQVTFGVTNTSVNYSGFESLRVVTGAGADSVTVESTAAGVGTMISDSGGDGFVRVGAAVKGTLDDIAGPLTVNGGTGKQQLIIDDSNSTGLGVNVFQISGSQVNVPGRASIQFTNFDLLEVFGGVDADRFLVTPDANMAIMITGGGPSGGDQGDSLTINRAGTINAQLTANPSANGFSGTWTFDNRATVSFTGIEQLTPRSLIAVGAGPGGSPHIRLVDGDTGVEEFGTFAFDATFRGGVRVAVGDVNNDGTPDLIAGAGSGGGPHVKIFDGANGTLLREFFAFDAGFTGGIFVASGDVNNDGFADVVVAAGAGGGPHVKIYSGKDGSILRQFFAYDASFRGGVSVAAGDVNADGRADVITGAGAGGGPHVRVFSGLDGSVLREFFAYAAAFRGGVSVAAADLNADGRADVITGAGAGGGPHVLAYSGLDGTVLRSFFAYAADFSGGVQVGASDVNGDGTPDILVASGPGSFSSRVRAFDGLDLSQIGDDELAFGDFQGGIFVGGM